MFTKQFVTAQNVTTDMGDALVEKFQNEEGEIASQIIVMAMLVGVAVALKAAETPLKALVTSIVSGVN